MHSCGYSARKGWSWPNFWANLVAFSLELFDLVVVAALDVVEHLRWHDRVFTHIPNMSIHVSITVPTSTTMHMSTHMSILVSMRISVRMSRHMAIPQP